MYDFLLYFHTFSSMGGDTQFACFIFGMLKNPVRLFHLNSLSFLLLEKRRKYNFWPLPAAGHWLKPSALCWEGSEHQRPEKACRSFGSHQAACMLFAFSYVSYVFSLFSLLLFRSVFLQLLSANWRVPPRVAMVVILVIFLFLWVPISVLWLATIWVGSGSNI